MGNLLLKYHPVSCEGMLSKFKFCQLACLEGLETTVFINVFPLFQESLIYGSALPWYMQN